MQTPLQTLGGPQHGRGGSGGGVSQGSWLHLPKTQCSPWEGLLASPGLSFPTWKVRGLR